MFKICHSIKSNWRKRHVTNEEIVYILLFLTTSMVLSTDWWYENTQNLNPKQKIPTQPGKSETENTGAFSRGYRVPVRKQTGAVWSAHRTRWSLVPQKEPISCVQGVSLHAPQGPPGTRTRAGTPAASQAASAVFKQIHWPSARLGREKPNYTMELYHWAKWKNTSSLRFTDNWNIFNSTCSIPW